MASDIPQRLLDEAVLTIEQRTFEMYESDREEMAGYVARALIEAEARGAERMKERAAEVADEHEKARWGGTADPTVAVRTTALSIATAIRNLETKDAG